MNKRGGSRIHLFRGGAGLAPRELPLREGEEDEEKDLERDLEVERESEPETEREREREREEEREREPDGDVGRPRGGFAIGEARIVSNPSINPNLAKDQERNTTVMNGRVFGKGE